MIVVLVGGACPEGERWPAAVLTAARSLHGPVRCASADARAGPGVGVGGGGGGDDSLRCEGLQQPRLAPAHSHSAKAGHRP